MRVRVLILSILLVSLLFGLTAIASAEVSDLRAAEWLKIGGRIHADLAFVDNGDDFSTDDGFRLRRSWLFIRAGLTDEVSLNIIEMFGGSSQLLGAWVDLNYMPEANVRVGQFHMPISLESILSSNSVKTMERSNVSDYLVPAWDVGVMVHGNILENKLEYQFAISNGTGTNTRATENDNFMYSARLVGTPMKDESMSLQIGANVMGLHNSTMTGTYPAPLVDGWKGDLADRTLMGADVVFNMDALDVRAEFLQGTVEIEGQEDYEPSGFYVQGSYAIPMGDNGKDQYIEPVVKYEVYDYDTASNKEESKITLGVNYAPWKGINYIFKVNYVATTIEEDGADDLESNAIKGRLQVLF